MILTREQYQIIGTKVYKFVHYFNVPTTNIGTVFNDFFIKYAGDVLVLLYICFIILIICEKLFEKSLKNSIITNLFYYIESELSKLNGVVIIISVIFVVIFLDLLILVSSFTEVYYNSLVVWILIMVIYIVFIIPVFILYDEGFYFLAFLRGSASKNSLLWEFVVDYMSVISFFLRINIQLIRVLIITVFF